MQLSIGQIPEDTQVPVEIERRETLLDTQSACGVALDILNEMLLFDRLETGSLVLHKQYVPVPELVEDSIKMFIAQAREKRIELSIMNNDENTTESTVSSKRKGLSLYVADEVSVDKTKVIQVIRNVLSNAIKFTPASGKIQVNVRFEPRAQWSSSVPSLPQITLCCGRRRVFPLVVNSDGNGERMAVEMSLGHPPGPESIPSSKKAQLSGELVIEIKDTGVGISEQNQQRLFKEVVQFSPELLQNGGGSGLGMCISKSLIDMHGGAIGVFSEGIGHGSIFTIRLPMVRTFSADESEAYTPTLCAPSAGLTKRSSARLPDLQISSTSPTSPSTTVRDSTALDILPTTRTSLPSTKEEPVSLPVPVPDQRPADLPSPETSMRFLVVDDSKMNRKMLCRLLQTKGHKCAEAEDGVQAVEVMTAALSTPPPLAAADDVAAHGDSDAAKPSSPTSASVYDAVLMDFMLVVLYRFIDIYIYIHALFAFATQDAKHGRTFSDRGYPRPWISWPSHRCDR